MRRGKKQSIPVAATLLAHAVWLHRMHQLHGQSQAEGSRAAMVLS